MSPATISLALGAVLVLVGAAGWLLGSVRRQYPPTPPTLFLVRIDADGPVSPSLVSARLEHAITSLVGITAVSVIWNLDAVMLLVWRTATGRKSQN